MNSNLLVLMAEAMAVYFLVLWTHAQKHRVGLGPFYALLGGITAIMSWVTDAGVAVEIAGIIFMVGSTVFYTALLLGVFVVYVFDGPRATRTAILTIAGISALVPLIAQVLHIQMDLAGLAGNLAIPRPSPRINVASVLTTVADFIFLAIAWEFLGRSVLQIRLGLRAFLVLLGVMWLDVLLFATLAFGGEIHYISIVQGTLLSRLIISLFASPFLYFYLRWQQSKQGVTVENRPILTILSKMASIQGELTQAQQEIERRRKLEIEKERLIQNLQETLARVKKLEGLLPICSACKKIRLGPDRPGQPSKWVPLEDYILTETTVQFSHGICQECSQRLYPGMTDAPRHDTLEAGEGRATDGCET